MMSTATGDSTLSSNETERAEAPPRKQPFLFVVLRADQPLAPPSRHALGDVDEVQLRRGAVRANIRVTDGGVRRLVLTIPDRWMSGEHARLRRDGARWVLEDAGSKNGTLLGGCRIQSAPLEDGDVLEVGHTFLLFRAGLLASNDVPRDSAASDLRPAAPLLATLSPALDRTFRVLADVARSTIPIHVSGETGTGKEIVARSVHQISARAGTFVAVNCGALPPNLVEAELFGFRRGAFSGALEDRAGLVRTADGGTLLLDEIGDLPHTAQAALLRVLQEREVLPVGAVKPVPVDVRVVSATHHDLEAAIGAGRFRADLLARLTGFRVRLPALRERREDLGLLLAHMIGRAEGFAPDGVSLSVAAARALLTHAWPRNVRELEHRVLLGVVLAKGGLVEHEHLFGADAESSMIEVPEPKAMTLISPKPRSLSAEDEIRRAALEALLREHHGNISAVARAMGKARMQIQRWIKRYELEVPARDE